MNVDVIIPTYNRAPVLRRTLQALATQSFPADRFNVLVVDDGSSDDTRFVCESAALPHLRYLSQAHDGATAARNLAASQSDAELLLFLDDDITMAPWALHCLVQERQRHEDKCIVVGTLIDVNPDAPGTTDWEGVAHQPPAPCESVAFDFIECLTGCLMVRRADFEDLGMLQNPAPGYWPNWDDVDFAYRAYEEGFSFHRSLGAVCYHWDHAQSTLRACFQRWERAGEAAALLFRKHPGLIRYMPMFEDKTPIVWGVDSARLVANKLFHQLTAWSPVLHVIETLALRVERQKAHRLGYSLLSRWGISAYILRGYQAGLSKYGGRGGDV
ncbi:MAG: glycosyltransferase family 2 protein [Anaerolineae bacterium]|nr:glycosyltransferase family 2 protein [Anaerolineae bacterium]